MTMVERQDPQQGGKPLTGRAVLFWIIGFFAVIFLANGIFVYVALGSFPGVVVESSYKAGQIYNRDIADAKAQADRGWQVTASLRRSADSHGLLRVEARDKAGNVLTGLVFKAVLEHPTYEDADQHMTLQEVESGVYQASLDGVASGNWELVLDGYRDGKRLFRSQNKTFLSE